jgi:hypothetical protein
VLTGVEAEPFVSYSVQPGVRIDVFNESKPYGYSNVFHVKLRVVARFAGSEAPYERTLERLGVSDRDLVRVRTEMLESFEACSLPYLLRADFPKKLAAYRQRERRSVVHFPVPR